MASFVCFPTSMNGSGMENPEGSNKCALTSVLQYTRHVRLLVRKAMEVADATKEPEKVLSEEGRMLLEKLSRSGNSTHGNVRDARSRAQTRPRNRQGSICVHRRASVANIHPCASFCPVRVPPKTRERFVASVKVQALRCFCCYRRYI